MVLVNPLVRENQPPILRMSASKKCSQYIGYSRSQHRLGGGYILMDGNPFDCVRVRPLVMPSILGGHRQMVARFPNHFAQSLRKTSIRVTERDKVSICNLTSKQDVHRFSQFMLNLILCQSREQRMPGRVRPERHETRARHFLHLFPRQKRTAYRGRILTQGSR